MSKNDLLARAKSLNIIGRHDMSKEDLEIAVRQREMIASNVEAVKEEKAASKGKKLTKTTNLNLPWQKKYYYLNVRAYELRKEIVAKAPAQVQLLLKSMIAEGTVDEENAAMGVDIASAAIQNGGLKTIIEPRVLFAYYREKMEKLGLTFAGYNIDA